MRAGGYSGAEPAPRERRQVGGYFELIHHEADHGLGDMRNALAAMQPAFDPAGWATGDSLVTTHLSTERVAAFPGFNCAKAVAGAP